MWCFCLVIVVGWCVCGRVYHCGSVCTNMRTTGSSLPYSNCLICHSVVKFVSGVFLLLDY